MVKEISKLQVSQHEALPISIDEICRYLLIKIRIRQISRLYILLDFVVFNTVLTVHSAAG